ncbi:hypothetical protein JIQ42_04862 [Leishmania sp. Namibia]|uniref:hypothetical protein n=1 Tax=Leishmania sp. Namibia TaxID=2802991 RepID=UPI001B42E78D|nr:hypothetical protein JIQ42_04862 [Leishmania sp. Namibia]
MQQGLGKRLQCRRAAVRTVSATMLALLCTLLCGCCLAGAAVEVGPLVLHTSLVDLLNAENALWTVSLGTLHGTGQPAVWTAMQEVHVETQPSESAASLLFTLPALASSADGVENTEEGKYNKDDAATEKPSAVPSDDVFARVHHSKLFGNPALSFHGLSCEEYRTGGRGQRGSMQGRCFFLRGDSGNLFVHYKVDNADIEKPESGGEEAAAAKATISARRRRQGRSSATASSGPGASGTEPRTVHSASASGLWTEQIAVLGGSPVETSKTTSAGAVEEYVRVGDVTIDEYMREMPDAHHSKQLVLTFAMVVPKASASAAGDNDDVLHVRLECITGAFYEDMLRRTKGAVRASRTSVLHRWMWPVLFVGAIYAMVAATAWLVAWRKASQGNAASATAGTGKKQQ